MTLVQVVAGSTASCAARSAWASSGSHLRLTRSESAPSWERANIFPATLNTDVLGRTERSPRLREARDSSREARPGSSTECRLVEHEVAAVAVGTQIRLG